MVLEAGPLDELLRHDIAGPEEKLRAPFSAVAQRGAGRGRTDGGRQDLRRKWPPRQLRLVPALGQ